MSKVIMKPKSRRGNIVIQNLDGETLIYDLTANKAFCLNETSGFVWQNCDGQQSVSEIAQALAKKTKQSINEDIIWLAIEDLEKENLLGESSNRSKSARGNKSVRSGQTSRIGNDDCSSR